MHFCIDGDPNQEFQEQIYKEALYKEAQEY